MGLMKMFGPKREEVAGGWRKSHNEELHDWYSTLNIIKLIKSRKMRWERYVAGIGKKKNGYRNGKPEGKRPNTKEGLGVDGSLLKTDLEEMGWVDVDRGQGAGYYERGNDLLFNKLRGISFYVRYGSRTVLHGVD
jgi:hypothetical protein